LSALARDLPQLQAVRPCRCPLLLPFLPPPSLPSSSYSRTMFSVDWCHRRQAPLPASTSASPSTTPTASATPPTSWPPLASCQELCPAAQACQGTPDGPRTWRCHESTVIVESVSSPNNRDSHIDASLPRQPLVKGERLVRPEVNAVMSLGALARPPHYLPLARSVQMNLRSEVGR